MRSIADAQNRDSADELAEVNLKRLLVVNRVGASAEYHSNDALVVFRKLVVRHNLAEGVELAHAASDELRGL